MQPHIWGVEPTPVTPTTLSYPEDVHIESSSRLPPVKREELDERGRKAFDAMVDAESKLRASLRGPTGFWLHIPELVEHVREINWYLRNTQIGLERHHRELAILVTARARNCQKEWTAHEPAAVRAGLDPTIVDVVKYRKPVAGIPEVEATIIEFGRELFDKTTISAETYARAIRVLGQRGVVHLVALMSNYTMTSVIFAALDQQVAPDQVPLLPIP